MRIKIPNRLNRLFKWFSESNRYKHFIFAIPIGIIFSILCVLGVASGLEFKDKFYGNEWDWIDWGMTMFGGIIGQCIQVMIIYFLLY